MSDLHSATTTIEDPEEMFVLEDVASSLSSNSISIADSGPMTRWVHALMDDMALDGGGAQTRFGKPSASNAAASRLAHNQLMSTSVNVHHHDQTYSNEAPSSSEQFGQVPLFGSFSSSLSTGPGTSIDDDEVSSDDDPGFHRIFVQPADLRTVRAGESSNAPRCRLWPQFLDDKASPNSSRRPMQSSEVCSRGNKPVNPHTVFNLKIFSQNCHTGAGALELDCSIGSIVAGRYRISEFVSSSSFSRVYIAQSDDGDEEVCLKIIRNSKECFDQGLDEVKILLHLNENDVEDDSNIVRLHDFFYCEASLVLVSEVLGPNLMNQALPIYLIQRIAHQLLVALKFVHEAGVIHADLKPENIVSRRRCGAAAEKNNAYQYGLGVKLVDFGSSCFVQDSPRRPYVQSRAYRAPEAILGCSYDTAVDIWSLGCVLCELYTGKVLFSGRKTTEVLAKMVGLLGAVDPDMVRRSRNGPALFTKDGALFERTPGGALCVLYPKKTSLKSRLRCNDAVLLDFLSSLLRLSPTQRPTAREALRHAFFSASYTPNAGSPEPNA